ncbi:Glycosyl hydrolases family 43 [Micromonospora nigra]|uniref:Glycosyl hydrolases family 43 n=1 Tax=Micromonospora nigra TaxID=145857 RepID=A0A1C6SYC8_9ACTN|nr:AbfB domain-containing protein [Micromonospora nigra]SCL34322.1 Glycosyl hydrolases family 43 [Micromonospora nigra]
MTRTAFRRVAAYLVAACVAVTAALVATPAQAANPIVNRFAADPSMLVANDRMYIYATDDQGNSGTYWDSDAWRVYSSSNLVDWTDHGAPFAVGGFSWARQYAWAPSAVRRNGYYYLYLPVDRTKIGVARSTSPTGGFSDPRGTPLIERGRDANTGEEPIDPAAFVDDNGQAYLYFGGARAPKVVRLNADLTSTSGAIQNITISGTGSGTAFGEAGFVHKRNGLYYYSYSTGWPGRIAYATATNPLGPFTYRGIVLDYTNNNTNHHSIAEFNGRWYIAYHRNDLPGSNNFRRSLAMEYLTYNSDGTIRPVTQTSVGVGTPTSPANRLQSYNFTDRYVRHVDYDARIDANVSPLADSQWRIVPGLASSADGNVSLESVNFPGYYLRHANYDFVLAQNDNSATFRADATFKRVPGLADAAAVSFRSYNFPDRYLRHSNYLLRLDPITDATGRADATFRITS